MAVNNFRWFRKKPFLSIFTLLVAVCFLFTLLELTNTTHFFHNASVPKVIPVKTSKNSSDKKPPSTANKNSSSDATNPDKIASSGGGSGSSLPLVQPYGSLVSNHFPGQHGSDTKEQSVCNSTPGASCYIQFSNTATGKVTKLPSQTISNDGSTLWLWDAATLTSGKWQIKAFASLNGQTQSVTDSMVLEIQ